VGRAYLITRREANMYTTVNFKTKKSLREAVQRGERVGYYQPGPFGGNEPSDGTIYLEGPHYPAAHSWYASATVADDIIVKVR
jgi:hypothetical protein